MKKYVIDASITVKWFSSLFIQFEPADFFQKNSKNIDEPTYPRISEEIIFVKCG